MTSAEMSAKRRQMFIRLAMVVGVLFVAVFIWDRVFNAGHVSTDNAYVGADSAEIMPLVSGHVASVAVDETDIVKAGDVLLTLDKADAELKLRLAQAALEQARRAVLQARSVGDALRAALSSAKADLARTTELARRGNAPQQDLQHNIDAVSAAEAQLAANQRVAGEGEVDEQPSVQQAQVQMEQAQLELARTTITAPIDGVIAKRNVQLGQYITPGAAVMAVVPVQSAYVDANFKESQLRDVRVGQRAELTSDMYGSKVVFHGRVTGLGGGTGSAFALIPAQNATGNWIKIVQRLPVRIALDPQELAQHPLRVGLSMEAVVYTTTSE